MEPARRPALERRVEKISSQAQLAELLVSCWPAEQTVGAQNLGEVLVSALLQKVPGDPKLIPTDIARVIEEATANRYVGLGIQVAIAKKEARPQITNPFKHGVAYKAGVRPGDLLLQVGDKDTKGVPLTKIVDWLRGAEGSHVAITVQTRGAQSPRTYHLTRSVVPFESILGFRRAGDDGWNYRIDSANTIGRALCMNSVSLNAESKPRVVAALSSTFAFPAAKKDCTTLPFSPTDSSTKH
jgi:hypothetical protein